MAEALGVFTASAQLLGLLAGSIIKAKRLWNEIDRAPSEIRDLMDEIQAFRPILAALETLHHHDDENNGLHVKSSVECYSKAHATFKDLVQSLSNEIGTARGGLRRKAAATRVVLCKRSVARLEVKLRSAKHVLELSLSLSSLHWIGRSYEVITETQSLLRDMRHGDKDGDKDGGVIISGGKPTTVYRRASVASPFGNLSVRSNNYAWSVTIHLPHWLTGTVWHLWMRKPFWDVHFRHYNIRPAEADIFLSVSGGHVEKMLLLFNKRDASPFDRDPVGRSLLYYAAVFHQPAICKILLNMGLKDYVDEDPGNGITPREGAYARSLSQMDGDTGNRDVIELFLGPARDPPSANDCRFLLFGCERGPSDLRSLCQFQQEVAPQYFDLPVKQRLEAARAYSLRSHSRRHPDATVFKFLIRKDADIQPADYVLGAYDGYSLVHSIAISLGMTYRQIMSFPTEYNSQREGRWLQLLRRVLGEPSQQTLHLVEHARNQYSIDVGESPCEANWVGTPLLSVLRGSVAESLWDSNAGSEPFKEQWKEWQSILSWALGYWLTRLMELGVDLEEYGRRERAIFRSMTGERATALDFMWVSSWWSDSEKTAVQNHLPVRLCRFEFDAHPSGWLLVWDLDIEQLAGEFWGLVESESVMHMRIPGQWID